MSRNPWQILINIGNNLSTLQKRIIKYSYLNFRSYIPSDYYIDNLSTMNTFHVLFWGVRRFITNFDNEFLTLTLINFWQFLALFLVTLRVSLLEFHVIFNLVDRYLPIKQNMLAFKNEFKKCFYLKDFNDSNGLLCSNHLRWKEVACASKCFCELDAQLSTLVRPFFNSNICLI